MAFAILRTGKLKSAAAIRLTGGHNSRTIETPNAAGKIFTWVDPGPDPHQRVMDRIRAAGIEPRANSVLAQEILMTASPEYFRPTDPARAGWWEKDRTKAWAVTTRDWIKSQYGDRLVSLHLHLDESTPHLHAVVVPITDDGRLSARDLFGPRQLRDLQTSYARAMAPLGLERGIEGSKASHERVKAFYQAVNAPAPPSPTVDTPPLTFSAADRLEWAQAQTDQVALAVQPIADKAAAQELARRKAAQATATAEQLRRESARVRALSLPHVLAAAGLALDPDDKNQWKGLGMRISLGQGAKQGTWFDHEAQKGSGGAIDLAMHLTGASYRDAVAWLGGAVGDDAVQAEALHQAQRSTSEALAQGKKSAPPPPAPERLPQVRKYLTQDRGLAPELIEWMIRKELLYADGRGNAVFKYGVDGEGVELRGTIPDKPFHSYRGVKSWFYIPPKGSASELAVCESAIDALSYRQLHPGRGVIAVAGGVSDEILRSIAKEAKERGHSLIAAFDADEEGRKYSARLRRAAVPVDLQVQRHEPQGAKDWNEVLLAPPPSLDLDELLDQPLPTSSFPQEPLPEFEPRGPGMG